MLLECWTSRPVTNRMCAASRFSLCLISTGLLMGCGQSDPSSLSDAYAQYEPAAQWHQGNDRWDAAPAATISAPPAHTIEYPTAQSPEPQLVGMMRAPTSTTDDSQHSYWSFSTDLAGQTPLLVQLPPVVETQPQLPQPQEDLLTLQQLPQLLPPQEIHEHTDQEFAEQQEGQPPLELGKSSEFAESGGSLTEIETETIAEVEAPVTVEEPTAQERALTAILQDASTAATGVLTDSRVNELAKAKIQNAYALAGRSAFYAARQELIEVLRMISQEKDAKQGTPQRSAALAAGLRALREAEDFAPHGTQLEAELEIAVLCASHRTPVAQQADAGQLLPRLMMDRYLRYAQLQLAISVVGDPAGSMALHALGKISSQLGHLEAEKNQLADRHAVAYQQAALLSHSQNYLAAHELGVLLATSGHFAEAQRLLIAVASYEPNAVVYRNLARIEEKLGNTQQALANRAYAQQLSQQGATGTNNIQWVAPNQFAQAQGPAPRYVAAGRSAVGQQLLLPGSRHPTSQQTFRR